MNLMLDATSGRPEEAFAAGDTVITEGAEPGRLLVLVSGSVTVERDDVPFARIDSPGAVFGEMSAVLDKPATATVRAATDTVMRIVDDPIDFLTEQPGVALHVLRTTATRLDGLTQYLVDVKQQFQGLDGHLGMVDGILDTLVHHQARPSRPGSVRDPEGAHEH